MTVSAKISCRLGLSSLQLLGAAVVIASAFFGCGGKLTILESDLAAANDPSKKACTPINPQGVCPENLNCCNGICAQDCAAWLCDCAATQACALGACVDIDADNQCSPSRPDGLCVIGQVCVGGTCVPISGLCGCDPPEQACNKGVCTPIDPNEACQTDKPQGLCPDGSVCLDGRCLPLNNACGPGNCQGLCPVGATCVGCRCQPIDTPCNQENPNGQCPACYTCGESLKCELATCSPETPACACAKTDEYCDHGTCQAFACGPSHLAGVCENDEFCCATGMCVPFGSCCQTSDCQIPGTFCSVCSGLCITGGSCLCDTDCGDFFVCNIAKHTCERNFDCPGGDSDCPTNEFCDSAGQCRPDGTCGLDIDCQVPGTYCSICEKCISSDTCCREVSDQKNADCADGQFCSIANHCLAPPACGDDRDCNPGEKCINNTCEVSGTVCTSNGAASCVASGEKMLWCCDPLEKCCGQGQHCSSTGVCIADGLCNADTDCLEPAFVCIDNRCVSAQACPLEGCSLGSFCSQAGACIPVGQCAIDGDCAFGEVCNAVFECEPSLGCGHQEFGATLVPPNMLVVLDRSSSMRDCVEPTTKSRWDVARESLAAVLQANSTKIRFGLSTYPYYCVGSEVCAINACYEAGPPIECNGTGSCTCSNDCDWNAVCRNASLQFVCDAFPPCRWDAAQSQCVPKDSDIATGPNGVSGDVDVAVGDNRIDLVIAALSPPTKTRGKQHPGGQTPTGRTLRNIAANPGRFGLPSPDDSLTRDNYIMLITDGRANFDGGTYGVCDGSGYDDLSRVNCVLDHLTKLTPKIKTFAVGFVGTSPEDMNCHAVSGGTSRCATPAECAAYFEQGACENRLGCYWSSGCLGGIDQDNCATDTVECYYRANNSQELTEAFSAIAGQIESCSFALDQQPYNPNLVFVYLDYACADYLVPSECLATPGCQLDGADCRGNPVRLERDWLGLSNWDYDVYTNQVVFAGEACDDVKQGAATPVVILGCCTGEGC